MAKGCMIFVKWMLMLFNFLFLISGLGILIVGTIAFIKFKSYTDLLGSKATAVPTLLIVVGCLVIVITIFGCAGTLQESYGTLVTFAVLMLLIFILEIAGGIAAYVEKDQFIKLVDKQLSNSLTVYGQSDKKDMGEKIWDHVQKSLHCCGINQYGDWNRNPVLNQTMSVPQSCCIKMVDGCARGVISNPVKAQKSINEKGCSPAFRAWVKAHSLKIGAVGVGIAFLQILGIILACILGRDSKTPGYDTV